VSGLPLELRGASVRRLPRGADASSDPATQGRPVLADVSLTVPPGGTLSLLGESGGGKSTLLRLFNRLLDPNAGEVLVGGRPTSAWDVGDLRRAAVLVPQTPVSLGEVVGDELRLPLSWAGKRPVEEALREALRVVLLEDLPLERSSHELSGGERGRLGLARALCLAPPVLLLDEPTGSLDVRTARELLGRLRAWADRGSRTLVVVSHRPEDLLALGGEAAVLLGGRLRGPWPAEALARGEVDDDAVLAFLGRLGEEHAA
jgi:putative ABC transport system ATP-binding protein